MPKHRSFVAIAIVVFFVCLLPMHGAPAPRAEPKFSIKFWDTDTDVRLPQASVLCMVQTRDGYLWLGTLLGLVRFDGARFTVFDENNTPALKDSRIVFLFEDSRRNLWIGTENAGVVRMKDGRFSPVPELAAGGSGRRLRAACEDATGAVWLCFENGLWRYASNRFAPFTLSPPEEVRAIAQETNGPLWIGTLHHQYPVSSVPIDGSLALPIDGPQTNNFGRLDALVASRHGGYWRLADGVIERCADSGTAGRVAAYPASENYSACEDRNGNLVVGTKEGVFWCSPQGTITWLTTTNGLLWPYVLSVLVDREGTLWIGTDGGGLYRVQKKTFDTLEPFRNWTVQSVTEDADGGLWIASNGNGMGYWNGALTNQFLAGVAFKAIFADHDKRLWVSGVRGPLSLFQNGGFREGAPRGLIQNPVQAIYQDRAGRMWFGSEGGLAQWEKGEWKSFTQADGLSANNITAIADAADGNIWIGTRRDGVIRWRDGKFTPFRQSAGERGDDISALLADGDGVLWVATFASGLGRFQNGKWTRYTTRDGLASNNLGYLLEDDFGNLWIGSNDGVLRVAKKALNDFASGLAKSIPCRAYDKSDGLPTRECSSGSQPGAWRARDGKLWFSTIKGVAAVSPAALAPNTNPPLVTIESVLVDDVPLRADKTLGVPHALTLEPRDERLEIQYSSLNLGAPDRVRFRYRMEGFEKDWTETGQAGKPRAATYRKLPPGHYTFHVTAANEDGVRNDTGASLGITVHPPPPPLWKRPWFIVTGTLSLVGLIVAVVHYLSTQKLQRQVALLRQQEALEKERARIARDIHDQVGASLTQVALLGELVETDKDSPDEVQGHAQQISQTARETTRALDEIVWTVNPQNDTLEGLVNYICKYAQDYLAVAGLRYRFDIPAQLPAHDIAPDVRHNVFLASKEAVTNVVRHARATAAWVRLKLERDSFTLEVEDNGRGVAELDLNAPQTRNGLKNMRKRMEDVGGTFTIGPGSEGGALVRLTVPLAGGVVDLLKR